MDPIATLAFFVVFMILILSYITFIVTKTKRNQMSHPFFKQPNFSDVEFALLGEEDIPNPQHEKGTFNKHLGTNIPVEIDFPLELILEGNLLVDHLEKIKKDADWLNDLLLKKELPPLEAIDYAVIDSHGTLHATVKNHH